MRAPVFYLCALLMVITISTSEATTFRAYYQRPSISVPLADSGELTTAPFDVSGFTSNNGQQQGQWFLGSCADEATDPTYRGSCFNGGYTDFMGQILENKTEIELCHDIYTASGDAGSCTVGGRIVGEITFDVTFTCAGQNGSVPVSLNVMAVGTAEYGLGTGDLKLLVAAGPNAGIDGVWVAEKEQLWEPLSSTGMFSGSSGDVAEYEWGSVETLDGAFTGEEFMAPLNTPVTVTLRAELIVLTNYYHMRGGMRGHFRNGLPGGPGIYLPRDGTPVFNLPPGCTANSVDIGLTNNDFIPEPELGSVGGQGTADCPVPGTALAGVSINAYDAMNDLVASAATDANGIYIIDDLEAGEYTISIVLPPDYTIPSAGVPVTVLAGQTATANFVANCALGSVAGQVTADCPAPGTLLEGVQVDAYEVGSGGLIGSALTDVNGNYAFDELAAGDYTITVVPPAGYETLSNNLAVLVVAGEAGIADFPLTCLPGSIVGRVTIAQSWGGDCPASGSGVYGVEVDAYEVGTGNLVATAVTDENGDYVIDEITPGDYTIMLIRPLSMVLFSGAGQLGVNVLPGETVTTDMPWVVCVEYQMEKPMGIGFWARQVAVGTGANGKAKYSVSLLCDWLDQIEAHFNSNQINQVIVYVPPASNECQDKLLVAKELLNLRGRQTMTARAKQHIMALLFNVARGGSQTFDVISADGATVSQAITYVDHLIDDPDGDHEKAKDICEAINNGDEIPAGMIPLSTPIIFYSPTGEGAPSAVELSLGQNYPNPFNPSTSIQFDLDRDQFVDLSIYSATGHLVRTLARGRMAQGTYVEVWDGRHSSGREVPTGIYFYRLKTEQKSLTGKMILLK